MGRDLYGRIFETAVFPILDRLNGTRIVQLLDDLLRSERLDPAEIRWRQEEKLVRAVERARAESEFYRRFWRERPSDRGLPSVYSSLDGLPVLKKADLVAHREAFPVASYRGKVIASRTSGSTGSPMTFLRSAEQESVFWALRFRIWQWAGYHPGQPYLEINLNPRVAWKKRLQDVLFRCSYLTFNTENQDSRQIIQVLSSNRIPFLNGFASSLYVLARHALEQDMPRTQLAGITSTGDCLYPVYRQAIEDAFGTRVLDYYGAGGEGLHVASQCPESGSRYHVHPEHTVVEILGPKGPVSPGEPGRIVVTQLDNEAMPLVRYDLEDVAIEAAESEACACGRTLPLLESIEGRVPDLVVIPGGTFITSHFFVVLFKNIQRIHRYQIVQEEPGSIRVRLVPRQGCDRASVETTVSKDIAAATDHLLEPQFEWLDEIPLSGAGKRRLVISNVSRTLLGLPSTHRQTTE